MRGLVALLQFVDLILCEHRVSTGISRYPFICKTHKKSQIHDDHNVSAAHDKSSKC